MELVVLLRRLWRLRILVFATLLFAIFIGVWMAYRIPSFQSRKYEVGIATATALIDTPSSQIVDLDSEKGIDVGTVAARAPLLASLMTSDPLKIKIAERAGVAPDTLIALAPESGDGPTPAIPGVSGASISATDPKANILRASVPSLESGQVPIIVVNTQAANADLAAKLANEGIAVLKSEIESAPGLAQVPSEKRVVLRVLNPARSATVVRGPARMTSVIVVVFLFLFGCALIIATSWLVRAWKGIGADDEVEAVFLDPFEHDLHVPINGNGNVTRVKQPRELPSGKPPKNHREHEVLTPAAPAPPPPLARNWRDWGSS